MDRDARRNRAWAATGASRRGILLQIPATIASAADILIAAPLLDERAASGKKKRRKKRKQNRGSLAPLPAVYTPDAEELAFLDLLNAYRAQHGRGPLALHDQLGAAAEHHALDMAEQDYVRHQLSNGDSPLRNIMRFGYRAFTHWGEIIAGGFESADEVLAGWQTSRSHNQMMLDGHFDDVGIGRAYHASSSLGWYWVVTFGRTP